MGRATGGTTGQKCSSNKRGSKPAASQSGADTAATAPTQTVKFADSHQAWEARQQAYWVARRTYGYGDSDEFLAVMAAADETFHAARTAAGPDEQGGWGPPAIERSDRCINATWVSGYTQAGREGENEVRTALTADYDKNRKQFTVDLGTETHLARGGRSFSLQGSEFPNVRLTAIPAGRFSQKGLEAAFADGLQKLEAAREDEHPAVEALFKPPMWRERRDEAARYHRAPWLAQPEAVDKGNANDRTPMTATWMFSDGETATFATGPNPETHRVGAKPPAPHVLVTHGAQKALRAHEARELMDRYAAGDYGENQYMKGQPGNGIYSVRGQEVLMRDDAVLTGDAEPESSPGPFTLLTSDED